MPNSYFQFRQFTIHQDQCAMKVTTDACLFGAWVAAQLPAQDEPLRVLDIGAGTGLLSLMLAQESPNAMLTAIEINHEAAEQARQNTAASPFAHRITIMEADILSLPLAAGEKFDVIISNPPFYENDLTSGNPSKNLAHHHAGLTLTALLPVIHRHLDAGGRFYLLQPARREEELPAIAAAALLEWTTIEKVKQTPRHPVFRIMLEGRHKTGESAKTGISEMQVCEADGLYSKKFIALLKKYYLYL